LPFFYSSIVILKAGTLFILCEAYPNPSSVISRKTQGFVLNKAVEKPARLLRRL